MSIYGSAIDIVGSLYGHKQRERLIAATLLKRDEDRLALYTSMARMRADTGRRYVDNSTGKKCPCCGSYEYSLKADMLVCSYCRTPK